jgi:hypothetical protein
MLKVIEIYIRSSWAIRGAEKVLVQPPPGIRTRVQAIRSKPLDSTVAKRNSATVTEQAKTKIGSVHQPKGPGPLSPRQALRWI